jgi:hypothetical protein
MMASVLDVMALGSAYWTGVHEYPGILFSADGRVLSLRHKKPRLLVGTRRGLYLALSCVSKGPYLHRVMCSIFHGPPPSAVHEVRHLDGNRDNNHADNLAWGTRRDNAMDRIAHGTDPSGERNPQAKLTRRTVDLMRADRAANGEPFRVLAKRYGVSTMTAFRAVRGQSWR